MPLQVRMTDGSDGVHLAAADWDIDRERDLLLYDRPAEDPAAVLVAVYASGQWVRVMIPDDPAPAKAHDPA